MKTAILLFALIGSMGAQAPTGTIAGLILDESGGAVLLARLKVVSLGTNVARDATSSESGDYSFLALLAGEYEVSVEADQFQRIVRRISVEAGATTTADFALRPGDKSDSITVEGASPQIRYDSHSVGSTITRSEIQNLPLNGRSFLELAKLEPGVQPPWRSAGNRTQVPILGAPGGASGRGTRVTIDGGSIMGVGAGGGSVMGFSQDVVQEFQISTVNFDLSTGLTFTGAINVATRSGGNVVHGSAFYFFRDHNLSAYPALKRDPANRDPFFQRRQFGAAVGGPVSRDRVFFFGNWERTQQRGVSATTLFGPDFGHLSGTTSIPLFGDQLSFRLDGRLSSKHTAFVRYSHDGSRAFGPGGIGGSANTYPSNWVRELTWADQSLLGITTVLRPTLVNDFRLSYFYLSSNQLAPEAQDCPGCLGIGAPMISVLPAGLVIGQSTTSRITGRRFHWNDSVAWQRGTHRVRFGVDWEHNRGGSTAWANEPVTMTLFSPDDVRRYNQDPKTGADFRIPLPAAFNTLNDVLHLPLQSITVSIGDPRIRQANGSRVRSWSTARLYFEDAWRLREGLTLKYGLAWSVDGYKNYDLTKPEFLAPILGADGLGPTRKQWKNFSPSLGVAWAPSRDRKLVIHAGAGIYYDSFVQGQIEAERALLGPAGSGRQTILGSGIGNSLSGIPGVPTGTPLNFTGSPTLFTGANLLSTLTAIRTNLASSLANADPSLRSIQILKQAAGGANVLFPADVPSGSAQHINLGFQREIARRFVVGADLVFRHFIHGGMGLGGLDLNHFSSVRGPVIRKCEPGAERNDPRALCSNGPIQVWQSTSNQTYKGLLLRADKRFSHRFQMLGSYAWSSNIGTPGTGVSNPTTGALTGPGLDLDNWHQTSRPLVTDFTRIGNVAGVFELPRRFNLSFNFSYSSPPPFSPTVGGADFNGDGTTGDLLPGTAAGAFNRGLGRGDLVRLVDDFNQTYALKPDTQRRIIPRITLPGSYSFDHGFQSLDVRLSRTFVLRDRWSLSLIGEVFNLYNAANLSGYSNDLTSPGFGQPAARFTQLFGSGGPRAFQLATRVSF